MRELFAELAANHMRHVRDFMIDVKWGEAPREWIEICVPAVTSLKRAAERVATMEIPYSGVVYIGASDLIPESYHAHPKFLTTAMTLAGAAVMYLAITLIG